MFSQGSLFSKKKNCQTPINQYIKQNRVWVRWCICVLGIWVIVLAKLASDCLPVVAGIARGTSVFTSQWELQKGSVSSPICLCTMKTNAAALVWSKLAIRNRCRHFNETFIQPFTFMLLSSARNISLEHVCGGSSQMWTKHAEMLFMVREHG